VTKAPQVSVVMATYNHADFVAQAIESVLAQRDVDLEFLIADDGSEDSTSSVVSSIRDERISFVPHESNRGACVVTNELIQRATGEYVALINSDDYWIGDDKLASQVQVLQQDPNVGACFGRVRFIDLEGRAIAKSQLPHGGIFDQDNRSRGAWLRQFFDAGNCLCHPTMLIRRSCYEHIGMYDNRLRQLPDFDMWVRLVKRYEIHVMDRELIAFRHLPGVNASAGTSANSRRTTHELYVILRRFFDGTSRDVLLDGFGDLLVDTGLADDVHLDIEKTLLYFSEDRPLSHVHRLIGLERLQSLLGSDAHRAVLIDRYRIDDRTLHSMAGTCGVLDEPLDAMRVALDESRKWGSEVNRQFVVAHRELIEAHRELDAAHRELQAAQRELDRITSSFAFRVAKALRHPRSSLRNALRGNK
jgi:glycosyltransferase involved in cell wall biosynthesis